MVRKTPHLKHFNEFDDDELIKTDSTFYPVLAKTLDLGLDRSLVGGFFANLGKRRMREGFPVSELMYAINLRQKIIIEYIMTEFAPENPVRMYQSMESISRVSEFFLLGCFYLTKGYLEEVYSKMNKNDIVSEEILKEYFKDDFFFKDE